MAKTEKSEIICPGAAYLKGTPTIEEKVCPDCGEKLEIFSNENHVKCKCGFIAYNDVQNCIKWCAYARKCVGDDIYEQFMERR